MQYNKMSLPECRSIIWVERPTVRRAVGFDPRAAWCQSVARGWEGCGGGGRGWESAAWRQSVARGWEGNPLRSIAGVPEQILTHLTS